MSDQVDTLRARLVIIIANKIWRGKTLEYISRNQSDKELAEWDEVVDQIELLFKKVAKESEESRIKENKSFCGCPMCTFHNVAYEQEEELTNERTNLNSEPQEEPNSIEDEIKHILGHCFCRDDSDCWFTVNYDKVRSTVYDLDAGDRVLSDEQDKAIANLFKKADKESRLDEINRLFGDKINTMNYFEIDSEPILERVEELNNQGAKE